MKPRVTREEVLWICLAVWTTMLLIQVSIDLGWPMLSALRGALLAVYRLGSSVAP